nr:hypothetical protein [Blastocatellia bacterium]
MSRITINSKSSRSSAHSSPRFASGALFLLVLGVVVVLMPATASAQEVMGDLDARRGSLEPTSTQLGIVSELGATAIWNDFGTPGSLSRDGGYLATGLSGPDATTVARNWVNAHKALFRLSSTGGLKVIGDEQLAQSNGYAINFRQEFGGLDSAEDGLLTVGIVGTAADGWKIAYVSSSITGDETLSGVRNLTARDAWLTAAANVGRGVPAANINNTKADRGWTILGVQGFANIQRVRLMALPTPTEGVRAVYE